MPRSFIPFILALIGLYMLLYASLNPFFEWRISEVVTDFPSSYEVDILDASPWKVYLGESLNNKSYVFGQIQVSENYETCSVNDLHFVVDRSRKDEVFEHLSLTRQINHDSIYWIFGWLLIEFVLAVAYSLWFTIWHEHRPISHAIIPVMVATIWFCLVFLQILKIWGPKIGSFDDGIANCRGTITFDAKLSKIYYLTVILWFTGIVAELTALAVIVRQVAMAIGKKRESSKSSVG